MKKIFIIAIIFSATIAPAFAQTADNHEIFITWQADNFFPSDYQGKAWATPFSPIKASVVLTKNKKIIDLTKADIFWYLDTSLIGHEIGRQSINFSIKKQIGEKHLLRTVVRPENGGTFESALEIPVLSPKIVTTNNFQSLTVPANSRLEIEATPFFFNIKKIDDLRIKWRVRGQIAEGSQIIINTGNPTSASDKTFFTEITADNKNNIFEEISKRTKMTIY
ncbi:MAG: hypothetical protein Q8L36_02385 [bacterium]|nr:hypothetical protein [bacterium]